MSSEPQQAESKKVGFSSSSTQRPGVTSWFHRVREVQLSQITLEQRSELEAKCQARQVLAKKAKACKGVSLRSKNAVYHTMNVQQEMMQPLPQQQQQQDVPPLPPAPGGGGGFGGASNNMPPPLQAMSRGVQASTAMGKMQAGDNYWASSPASRHNQRHGIQPAPAQPQLPRPRRASLNASDDELAPPSLEAEDMESAGRDASSDDEEIAHEERSLQVASDDISAVLLGLRQEPKDDELMAAKFEVYEKFSEKVTVIRSALEEVSGSALRDLPDGAPRQGVRNDLAKLESAEMSGIYDQSRYWFVHDMMEKTASNCKAMDGMSNRIEALLKFAASNTQTDCPICLRAYASTVPGQTGLVDQDGEVCVPKTLSCCHSVCRECWTEWSALQGSTAFCPLCRNKEFLEFLAQNAPPTE